MYKVTCYERGEKLNELCFCLVSKLIQTNFMFSKTVHTQI